MSRRSLHKLRLTTCIAVTTLVALFANNGFAAQNNGFAAQDAAVVAQLTPTSSPVGADYRATNRLLENNDFLQVEQAYKLSARVDGGDLLLDWDIFPGYYLYRHQFAVELIDGNGEAVPLEAHYQTGIERYDEYYERTLEVFYQSTRIRVPLSDAATDSSQPLALAVKSQGCADAGLCYPPRKQQLLVDPSTGTVRETALTPSQSVTATATANAAAPLYLIVCFALLGGVILNLMPCVFPVLSIKVLGLAQAHLSAHGKHVHGLAYTAGIILTFIIFAAALITLRGAGEAIGWGFQLQSPVFVGFLAYLFFIIAMSFSGHFTFGTKLMNIGQATTETNSLRSSFMTGVLATVVASPCTAPFMGTALGVALTQTAPVAIIIFVALGLGMALPFLALTWLPGLAEKMPKPGPWMETFRQCLAFPLYLSVIWLLWVLARQTSVDHAVVVVLGLLLLTFALWLLDKLRRPVPRILAVATLLAALAVPALKPIDTPQDWQPYSAARLETLLAAGSPVFINLTADWCITCLANEKLALNSDAFRDALKHKGIVYLKGDWTNYDGEITALLNQHGRSGVPLYLLYPGKGREALILPQLLTGQIILNAFDTIE